MSPSNGSMPADSYTSLVQQFYISYFGRPADPLGLKNFTEQMAAMQAPLDLGGVLTQMKTDAGLKALVDSFGNSAESTTLYGNDIIDFTIGVYVNTLNRTPDYEGFMFWSGEIRSGRLSKSAAALSIVEGALARGGADATILTSKSIISTNFTKSLDTPTELLAYVGDSAAVMARSILQTVTVNTDPQAFDLAQFLTGYPVQADGAEVTLVGNGGLAALDAPIFA